MPGRSDSINSKLVPNSANLAFAAPLKDTVKVLVSLLPAFTPNASEEPITGTYLPSFLG